MLIATPLAARTPARRLGLLLLLVAAGLALVLMLHWNFTESLFVYRKTSSWTVRIPQPSPGPEGAFWREGSDGWRLYASRCVEDERRKSTNDPMVFNLVLPSECQVRFVPYDIKSQTEWEQSVGQFWREITRGRAYSFFTLTVCFLLSVGLLLYTGVASKVVDWVAHGPREG